MIKQSHEMQHIFQEITTASSYLQYFWTVYQFEILQDVLQQEAAATMSCEMKSCCRQAASLGFSSKSQSPFSFTVLLSAD